MVEDLPGAANERRHDFDPATGARTRYLERLDGATLDVAVDYDRNGRLVREAIAGGATNTYDYDPAGQLTAATSGTTTLGISYRGVNGKPGCRSGLDIAARDGPLRSSGPLNSNPHSRGPRCSPCFAARVRYGE